MICFAVLSRVNSLIKAHTNTHTHTFFRSGHTAMRSVNCEIIASFQWGAPAIPQDFNLYMCVHVLVRVCLFIFCVCANMQLKHKGSQHLSGWDDSGEAWVWTQIHPLLFFWHTVRRLLEPASIWCNLVWEPNVLLASVVTVNSYGNNV